MRAEDAEPWWSSRALVAGVFAASVLSLLASLRYRVEPLLQTARIRMHWMVADDALLDSVRGDAARHILNLTQEALANVLRHSGADRVEITCCMHKGEQALMLEIADNGVGLRDGSAAGLAARQLGFHALGPATATTG